MTKETDIVGIKGFDADFKCRGFQFEVGQTYEHTGPVTVCESGFHAVSGHPFEVFRYYPPAGSRFAEVRQSGKIDRNDDDSKVASERITIDVELHLHEIAQRAVKWVLAQVTKASTSTCFEAASTSTGARAASTSTGDRAASTSTGARAASTSTGYQAASTSTGYQDASTIS